MACKLLRPRGFTLVEIMIALGVMSIGALGLMQMGQIQSDIQRKSKEVIGTSQVINIIQRHLSKRGACEATFRAYGGAYANGSQVPVLRRVDNDRLVDVSGGAVTPIYPDSPADQATVSSVLITDVRMVNVAAPVASATGNYESISFNLAISMRRMGDANNQNLAVGAGGETVITSTLPYLIQIRRDTSGAGDPIICATEAVLAVDTAVSELCDALVDPALANAYDSANDRCNLLAPGTGTPAAFELASVAYVQGRLNDFMTMIKGTYLRQDRDNNMSGTLEIRGIGNNLIETNANPLANGSDAVLREDLVPANFAGLECQSGTGLAFIRNQNQIICTSMTCPSGEYLKGFDSNGNRVCLPLIQVGSRCPNGGNLAIQSGGTLNYVCN